MSGFQSPSSARVCGYPLQMLVEDSPRSPSPMSTNLSYPERLSSSNPLNLGDYNSERILESIDPFLDDDDDDNISGISSETIETDRSENVLSEFSSQELYPIHTVDDLYLMPPRVPTPMTMVEQTARDCNMPAYHYDISDEELLEVDSSDETYTSPLNEGVTPPNVLFSDDPIGVHTSSPQDRGSREIANTYVPMDFDIRLEYADRYHFHILLENMQGEKIKATQEMINIHTVSFEYTLDNNDNNQSNCVICLCDFETGDMMRRLPCVHFFHLNCVERWLLSSATCPICRNLISNDLFADNSGPIISIDDDPENLANDIETV